MKTMFKGLIAGVMVGAMSMGMAMDKVMDFGQDVRSDQSKAPAGYLVTKVTRVSLLHAKPNSFNGVTKFYPDGKFVTYLSRNNVVKGRYRVYEGKTKAGKRAIHIRSLGKSTAGSTVVSTMNFFPNPKSSDKRKRMLMFSSVNVTPQSGPVKKYVLRGYATVADQVEKRK